MTAIVIPGLVALAGVVVIAPRAWYAWVGIVVLGAQGLWALRGGKP